MRLRDIAASLLTNPPAADDLGIDDQPTEKRRKKSKSKSFEDLPKLITITLPSHEGSEPLQCRVTSTGPLYIELSASVLTCLATYAQSCDTADVVDDGAGGNDEQEDLPKHIIHDRIRKAYRVRYNGVSKWFSESALDDPLTQAVAFLNSIKNASTECGTTASRSGSPSPRSPSPLTEAVAL